MKARRDRLFRPRIEAGSAPDRAAAGPPRRTAMIHERVQCPAFRPEPLEIPVIEINCDNCEKTFEIDDVEAGGKVPCPFCGDVNRVPEAAREPATTAAAPAAAPPSGGGADGPEQEVCVIRPAMFRAHPFRYILVALVSIAGIVGVVARLFTDPAWYIFWPSLLLGIPTLGYFGYWWLTTHWWVKLIITNKRSIRHEGIIKRHTTEVLHDHVRSVDITQTFLQRIFSVGLIGIDSAGQDQIEIQVRDIPKPYEIKATIDKYRKM